MRTTLTSSLQHLREQLTATVPGSISSPAGRALVSHVTRVTREYFESLEARMPVGRLRELTAKSIAFQGDTEATSSYIQDLTRQVGQVIEPVIHSQTFERRLARAEAVGFTAAATQVEEAARRDFGIEEALTEQAIIVGVGDLAIPQQTIDLGRKVAALRVTGIDTTTRRLLAGTIADAMTGPNRGVPAVSRAIRDKFDSFSVERAGLIANTEINSIMSQATLSRSQSLGARRKEWLTVGDDRVSQEICLPNEGQGSIPINKAFGSLQQAPPGHPRCRCALSTFGASRASVESGLSPGGTTRWLQGIGALVAVSGVVQAVISPERAERGE